MEANETQIVKAIQALTWLISDEDVLMPFLSMSGASIDDVKAGAGNPEFLGAALDFILTNDEWVTGCASHINVDPEQLVAIRASLPGGEQVHWT